MSREFVLPSSALSALVLNEDNSFVIGFGALLNNGQGVDLDPAHLEAMWNVEDTFTYEGGNQDNLKAVQKIILSRAKHVGPKWDPKTAKPIKKYVPPPPPQKVVATPKPSAAPAAGGLGGWFKSIFGGGH